MCLPLQCPRVTWLYTQPAHLHVRNVSAIRQLTQTRPLRFAYEIEVVLDHVVLEALFWQRAITHPSDELMVSILMPGRLDVVALKDILDE